MNSSTDTLNKFLFDVSFDEDAPKDEPKAPPPLVLTIEELESIKAAAYQDGASAARAEAQAQAGLTLADQMARVAAELQTVSGQLGQVSETQRDTIVTAIKAIAQNMMPVYLSKHGYEEMERLVVQCLAELKDEPRVVIRVAEAQLDESIKRFEGLATQSAFHGKLIILGDATLAQNDCRIEWADGGLERTMNTLWNEIEEILAKAMGTYKSHASAAPKYTETPNGENQ